MKNSLCKLSKIDYRPFYDPLVDTSIAKAEETGKIDKIQTL